MPGGTESMVYSWNMGPIHFVSISTEFYYFLQYGIRPVMKQYDWLVNDLEVILNLSLMQPRKNCIYSLIFYGAAGSK